MNNLVISSREKSAQPSMDQSVTNIGQNIQINNSLNVIVENVKSGAMISSPLLIKGWARGSWYFDGTFLIKLIDSSGVELGKTTAQMKGEWTMDQSIPFEATIEFKRVKSGEGRLIFERGNPTVSTENLPKEEFPVMLVGK